MVHSAEIPENCLRAPLWMHILYILQQECIPVGCVLSAVVAIGGMSGQGGVWSGGSVCPEGCLPKGCLPGEMSAQAVLSRGVYSILHWVTGCLPQCMLGYTHFPCGQNSWHACEDITFQQLHYLFRCVFPGGCLPRSCLSTGVSASVHAGIHTPWVWPGGYIPACTEADTPP